MAQRHRVADLGIELRQTLRFAAGRGYPPQIHFMPGGSAVNKINPFTIRVPCQIVVVLIGSVPEDFARAGTIAVNHEDGVACFHHLIRDLCAIRRPYRVHDLVAEEYARLTAQQGHHLQPAVLRSGEPELSSIVRKSQAAQRRTLIFRTWRDVDGDYRLRPGPARRGKGHCYPTQMPQIGRPVK